jgi:hypothetical protein
MYSMVNRKISEIGKTHGQASCHCCRNNFAEISRVNMWRKNGSVCCGIEKWQETVQVSGSRAQKLWVSNTYFR